MLCKFLNYWLIRNSPSCGLKYEAQVEIKCIPRIVFVLQSNRIAENLLSEHGSEWWFVDNMQVEEKKLIPVSKKARQVIKQM